MPADEHPHRLVVVSPSGHQLASLDPRLVQVIVYPADPHLGTAPNPMPAAHRLNGR
ncbi:MAG: hypothetical protein AB7L90_25770 [Hyphomicrobiaceae bacterium]